MKSLLPKGFQSISYMVEISGIEPLTSCLQGRRSPSWAKPPYLHLFTFKSGGPKWTRFSAEKPRRLKQSTGLFPRAGFRAPYRTQSSNSSAPIQALWEVVGQNGLEPSTSRLSVVCSSQLSYWPSSNCQRLIPLPSQGSESSITRSQFSSQNETRFAGLSFC